MLAAASGNVDAVQALLDARRRRQREGTGPRPDAGDVRRGLQPRRGRSTLLAKRGADLKATSKVTDLAALSKDPAALREITQRQSGAARRAAGRRTQRPGAAGGRRRRTRRPRRRRSPGVDRNYQLNELVAAQGGLTPLLLAARQGHVDAVQALLDAGADINQVERRRQDQPAADRDDQRPLRSREVAAREGRRTRTPPSENNATPLYAALNVRVGAEGALSAAARAAEPEDDLPRADEGAARQGRRSERPPEQEGLVLRLQLRSVRRRRDRRDAVLARRLRQRRRRDEDAGRVRRRSEHPHQADRRPGARRRRRSRGRCDVSGLPPVPVGGPAVTPLQAAAGVGYGEGFAANSHRFAPGGKGGIELKWRAAPP